MTRAADGRDYAVVHLVSQEGAKDLIGPQVVDPLDAQLASAEPGAPSAGVVVLLEAARVVVGLSLRARVARLRHRSRRCRVLLVPYVSRWPIERNVSWVAWRIRFAVGRRRVVFHCRTESAVPWALALCRRLAGGSIVLDVRGAWPEELLFARGVDGVEHADAAQRSAYTRALRPLQEGLAAAASVLTVSRPLAAWLGTVGADLDRTDVVPCCVPRITADDENRVRVRHALGVSDKLVLCYAGSVTGYQDVEDGYAAFVALAAACDPSVHALCLTNQRDEMLNLLARAGVPPARCTVLGVAQRDVAGHLDAADAAFLLRRDSRMNRVSMPIKLGEYLAAGLPVVVSRVPGWVDEVVGAAGAGIAVDWFGATPAARAETVARTLAALRAPDANFRARAKTLCAERFVWSAYTEVVRRAYLRALAAAPLR